MQNKLDNVPLVAAAQGMYPMTAYSTCHFFWEFLACCAATGGSIFIIGFATPVAAMGLKKFIWYLKKISRITLLRYLAGALVFWGSIF